MPARLHPVAAPCGQSGAADLASAAPLRRTGWPVWRGVASVLAAIGLTLTLGACAILRMIDSEVQSFVGTPPAVAGATYQFERLPSQQSQAAAQDHIEALAQTALQRVGLTPSPSDTQPRYHVQVQTQVVQFQPVSTRVTPSTPPFMDRYGAPVHSPLLFLIQPPWYGHTVQLVLRDAVNGQVAYETKARFDGPWSDSAALWPTIFEAALHDYPQAPAGVRTITIELPRSGQPPP